MSRSQNLRHNVINQVIDDMARGHIPISANLRVVVLRLI